MLRYAAVSLLFSAAALAVPEAERKPHVLFLMVDQCVASEFTSSCCMRISASHHIRRARAG